LGEDRNTYAETWQLERTTGRYILRNQARHESSAGELFWSFLLILPGKRGCASRTGRRNRTSYLWHPAFSYCLVAPNYSVWGSENEKKVTMVRVLAVGERPRLGPKALVTLSEMRHKSLLGIVYAADVTVRTTSYTTKTLYQSELKTRWNEPLNRSGSLWCAPPFQPPN
jgi:hypothetical protein